MAIQDMQFLASVKRELQGMLGRDPTLEEWARTLSTEASDIAIRIQAGGASKVKLMQANRPLVVHIAKRYLDRGIPWSDLLAEGMMGLKVGVEKFNPKRGCKFSTAGYLWIREALTKCISKDSRAISIPGSAHRQKRKIAKSKALLQTRLGRPPTLLELSCATNMSVMKIQNSNRIVWWQGSLDMQLKGKGGSGGKEGSGGMTYKDIVEDKRMTSYEAMEEGMA